MRLPRSLTSVPLRFRVAGYTFLAGALIVGLVVQQTTRAGEQRLERHHDDRQQTMLDLVSEISQGPLLTGEYSQHSGLLRELRDDDAEIEAIDLLDVSGRVVASSEADRVGTVDPPTENTISADAEGDVVTQPVTGPSGVLGAVRLTFDESADDQLIADQRRQGLLIGLLGVALLAILSMVGGRVFTDRLARLNAQLDDAELEGVPELIDIDGDDEIARIGAALNQRTAQIKESIETISRHREELRFSEARLQLALSAAVDTVVEVDLPTLDFSVIMPGVMGAELLSPDDPSAGSLAALVHPDDHPSVERALAESVERPDQSVEVEIRTRGTADDWRTVIARIRAFESGDTTRARVLIAMVDVTEQRINERRMVHADKMRSIGQLTSGITHDFNNVLGISTLVVSQLRDPDRDRSLDDERIRRLAASNDLAASMVKRLMLAARPQKAAPVVVDVNRMIEEVGTLLSSVLDNGVEIEIDLSAHDPAIRIDEGLAQQVLINLAQNAEDAMGGRGRLTVRTSNTNGDRPTVTITVSDTGPGIDPAVEKTLFEPFVTTKPIGAGTGLGLATTLDTVTEAGGTIHASNDPGPGATFTIELPVATDGGTVDGASVNGEGRVETTDRRILVVEDHPLMREVVVAVLELAGYEVVSAASPSQALVEEQALDRLDLLLTDVQLPDISGLELASRIKARRSELRILYMSGFVPDRGDAELQGADLLRKPFSNEQLLERVSRALDVPRRQASVSER